jgi:hypothetical protein
MVKRPAKNTGVCGLPTKKELKQPLHIGFMKNPLIILSLVLALFLLFGCDEVNNKVQDAVDAKNPSLCKELKEEERIEECYFRVAQGMNDPNVCFQMNKTNDCIGEYASSKRSIKYCDLIDDGVAKYGCIVKVTGDETGRAIDLIVKDWRGNGTISKCKEQCEAEKNACTSPCFETFTKKKDDCYKKYPGDYDSSYWCEDAARKEREDCYYDCWTDQDACDKGCEQ